MKALYGVLAAANAICVVLNRRSLAWGIANNTPWWLNALAAFALAVTAAATIHCFKSAVKR
jgi:hypothetical protein